MFQMWGTPAGQGWSLLKVSCRTTDVNIRGCRYLLPIKSNIGSDRLGLAYRIDNEMVGRTDHPWIAWEPEPVTLNIDELAGRKRKASDDDVDLSGMAGVSEKGEKLMEAMEWLVWRLAGGELSKQEILACSRRDGISRGTLDRAKVELGIRPRKRGFGQGATWCWSLPEDIDPADFLGDDWENQLVEAEQEAVEQEDSDDESSPKILNESPSGRDTHEGTEAACVSSEEG
jgi:hypothetical protein